MDVDLSLPGQLTDLAAQAAALQNSSLYEIQGIFSRDTREMLSNIVLEAQILLSGDSRFLLILHKLSSLGAHPSPQYLPIRDVLLLAAKYAAKPNSSVSPPVDSAAKKSDFVSQIRIDELKRVGSRSRFDVTRLVRLCEELNSSFEAGNFMASAMLLRAIRDHCPPIFEQTSFAAVVSNAPNLSRSVKQLLDRFENSMTHVADAFLHERIRSHEVLPSATQVSFQSEIDVLLVEIARRLART